MSIVEDKQSIARAWIYGFLGMAGFSLTLPMTRLAVTAFDPVWVGLGRALVAAVLGLILLIAMRQKIPPLRYWWRFALVAGGVVVGFPLLASLAMTRVPASHGAVIAGLIPIATAAVATWRGGERLSLTYWVSSLSCCVLVLAFAIHTGAGHLQFADIALFGGVLAAAVGYAEGALLARIFGHWQVICWALVLSALPICLVMYWCGVALPQRAFVGSALAGWCGFLYVSVISMFFAFMLWYRGLAAGGIAQVGQLQYLQPFMTIFAAVLWFDERWQASTLLFALGIALLLFMGRNLDGVMTSKIREWR